MENERTKVVVPHEIDDPKEGGEAIDVVHDGGASIGGGG